MNLIFPSMKVANILEMFFLLNPPKNAEEPYIDGAQTLGSYHCKEETIHDENNSRDNEENCGSQCDAKLVHGQDEQQRGQLQHDQCLVHDHNYPLLNDTHNQDQLAPCTSFLPLPRLESPIRVSRCIEAEQRRSPRDLSHPNSSNVDNISISSSINKCKTPAIAYDNDPMVLGSNVDVNHHLQPWPMHHPHCLLQP